MFVSSGLISASAVRGISPQVTIGTKLPVQLEILKAYREQSAYEAIQPTSNMVPRFAENPGPWPIPIPQPQGPSYTHVLIRIFMPSMSITSS